MDIVPQTIMYRCEKVIQDAVMCTTSDFTPSGHFENIQDPYSSSDTGDIFEDFISKGFSVDSVHAQLKNTGRRFGESLLQGHGTSCSKWRDWLYYEFCNEGQGGFASLGANGVTCTTYGSRLNRNYYESDSRVPILRSLQDAIDRQNE